MTDFITGGSTAYTGPSPFPTDTTTGNQPAIWDQPDAQGGTSPTAGSIAVSGGFSGIGDLSVEAPPSAAFTYIVYANGLVGFRSTSIGRVSEYSWDFGDGTARNNASSCLHQYVGLGATYPVTLYVANTSGQQDSVTQNVVIPAAPVEEYVSFSYVVGALAVQFTYTGNIPGTIEWDFGDGETSQVTNPYHAYSTAGTYQVDCTVGGVTSTQSVTIDRGIQLTWQDNSSDETGFKVEHSLNGSSWTQIATTGAGVNTLLVTQNIHGVDPAVLNYFRVRAYNGAGDSAYTNTASQAC